MYNSVNCFTIMNFYSKSERNKTFKGFQYTLYICVEMNEICKDYIFAWWYQIAVAW